MSDKQNQQRNEMMQESIDGQLSEDLSQQLFTILERDQEAAKEYDRLQQVDSLFKRAPHRRAPSRLAATIMARVAERIEAEAKLDALPDAAQQVMMMSMTISIMTMMPMMEAATWLVLNAHRDPELLGDVMIHTIGLMSMVTDALIVLVEDAETLAKTDPEVATATLALTPYMLNSILDYLEETLDNDVMLD
mgnify:CR=1 FL=1